MIFHNLPNLSSLPASEPRRRVFLQQSAAYMGMTAAGLGSPALVTAQSVRPQLPYGLQLGDTALVPAGRRGAEKHDDMDDGDAGRHSGRGLHARSRVWARSDRPARIVLEWDTTDRFANPRRIRGPYALEATDFTARVDLTELTLGQLIFTRVAMEHLNTGRASSEWLAAQFRTPSVDTQRGTCFVWGGDTAGQNFGINADFGGMRIYEQMRLRDPDFFVHCGDTIYADGPMTPSVNVEGGQVWSNLIAEGVLKVVETEDEFRGR